MELIHRETDNLNIEEFSPVIENAIKSANWPRMMYELKNEGFEGACDVVGMRVAKRLAVAGADITPVSVIRHGDTTSITPDQAHVAFILSEGGAKFWLDFTYAYYTPSFYKGKSKTTLDNPFLILPYTGSLPSIDGAPLYRAISVDDNIMLTEGIRLAEETETDEKDDEMEMMKNALRTSLTSEYHRLTKASGGLNPYGSLDSYIAAMSPVKMDDKAGLIPYQTIENIKTNNRVMRKYLKTGTLDDYRYLNRWLLPVKSPELNKMLAKLSALDA